MKYKLSTTQNSVVLKLTFMGAVFSFFFLQNDENGKGWNKCVSHRRRGVVKSNSQSKNIENDSYVLEEFVGVTESHKGLSANSVAN